MTDHITTPRALLEQALEVIVANTTGKDELESAIRAELAKPPTPAEPFAYTTGMFSGRFTVEPVNRATVIPAGIALYLHPPTAQHDAPDVAALKAERDAAMKDAKRYQWLRYGNNDEKVLRQAGAHYWYLLRNEKLDTAIDAAIAKAEGSAL